MDIYNDYHLFTEEIDLKDIKTIINICKSMKLGQKIIYGSVLIYYKHIFILQTTDKPTFFSACIGLASKLLEDAQKYKEIIYHTHKETKTNKNISEDVLNLELELLIASQFEINLTDLYAYIQKTCTDHCLRKSICRKSWLLLNDSVYLPLVAIFSSKVVVNSLIVFACKLENEDIDLKHDVFVIERMISFYEKCFD